MKRVFAYLRVSTAAQTEGDGFDRQLEAIQSFCARKGWTIARVFRECQSGSDEWSSRKLLTEAMELAGQQDRSLTEVSPNGRNFGVNVPSSGIDTIVVERSDRLSRDLIVAELFLRKCKEKGVSVYTADSGDEIVNSDGNPTRTLIRQVLGAVAQFDKSSIVQKMQAGRRAKALQTGKPCGGPAPSPYGDRGDIAQRNRERNVIRMILQWHSEGFGVRPIAAKLRNARVPTPHGDSGRRKPGVNPAWQWGYQVVAALIREWSDRADL